MNRQEAIARLEHYAKVNPYAADDLLAIRDVLEVPGDEEVDAMISRLREDHCQEGMGCNTLQVCACSNMDDAANLIESLASRVRELEQMLSDHGIDCDNGKYYGYP